VTRAILWFAGHAKVKFLAFSVRPFVAAALALKRKLSLPVSTMWQMMGKAVEHGRRHLGVAKYTSPFAEAQIGGDGDGGLLLWFATLADLNDWLELSALSIERRHFQAFHPFAPTASYRYEEESHLDFRLHA
jgi:hypothetical protein